MKTAILGAGLLLVAPGFLPPARLHATGLSAPTNGVYLAVGAQRRGLGLVTNDPIRLDDTLLFMPFCDTGNVELSYPLDPEYGVNVKMTDASGKELPRTTLGKKFGSKFDRLHSITDTRPYPFTAWESYTHNQSLGGARFFFDRAAVGSQSPLTPKDLFQMKDPGLYTLAIQMQMFRFDPRSTNKWNRELFRFPPVTVKVEKPRDEKPSTR